MEEITVYMVPIPASSAGRWGSTPLTNDGLGAGLISLEITAIFILIVSVVVWRPRRK